MKKRSKPLEDTIELNEDEILANFRALMAQELSKEEMVEREIDIYIDVNHIEKETTLPIVIDERKVNLRLPFDCILLADNLPGMCHILFSHEKGSFDKSNRDSIICECKLLINSDDYELLFKDKSFSEMRKFASTYAQLSKSQRNFFKEQFSSPIKDEVSDCNEPIVDEEGLRLLYNSCKHAYSPEIQKHAGLLFKELEQQRYGSNNRADILTKLSYMLNLRTDHKKNKPITYEEIMQTLNKHVYGMDKLKRLIADRVMFCQHCGRTISLLLVGNPGVGKTSVSKPLAQLYQVPYAEIKCESADPISLTGLVSSYSGSIPSIITRQFFAHGTTQMLLLFEEIDKLSSDEHKINPYAVFNSMLGPQRALHDEFLDVDISVSNTVVVATANSIGSIADYILNRFDLVLYIDDYSSEEKVTIAQKYAIPELLKRSRVSSEEIIFDDDVLLMIAHRYCDDHGARKIRSCIDSLICSVVSGWTQKIIDKPFRITTEYAKQELDELYLPDKKTSIGFTG